MIRIKPKILFVGFAVIDTINNEQYLGGAAGSMSLNAVKLGIESSLFAPLSEDKNGHIYQIALDNAGVNYGNCSFASPQLPTCIVKDKLGTGSTRDWQDNGALEYFHKMPVPQNLAKQFNAIFLCNVWKDIGEKIADATNTRNLCYIPGPKTANNPDWISTAILDKTLIVFGNEEESPSIWKSDPFSHGVEIVVTTTGSKGGQVHLKNGQTIPYSAIYVKEVVDRTGAGDSWSLGFAAEWIKSHDIISSINQGNKLSSECIQMKGAILTYGNY
jgi:sugar/nucleoside kinase (ribokinase family)